MVPTFSKQYEISPAEEYMPERNGIDYLCREEPMAML